MSTDFFQHINLINQFRGNVLNDQFETEFAVATKNIPKTERFLLKMELKRLAEPCTRLVDLRGLVDGECKPYEHGEQVHFLDDVAIKVFEENIAHYGSYTFGVYEAVTNTENNFRVIYQREKQGIKLPQKAPDKKVLDKTQYPAELRKLGRYFDRSEERMNFVIPVKVVLEDAPSVEATSSDISVLGCRLRIVKAKPFEVGQIVDLQFTGLKDEFKFSDEPLFYEVKNQSINGDVQLVGLKRVPAEEESKFDSFGHFLKGYIHGNKRRYKINLDNSIEALQSRTLESFTLPKTNELVVYLNKQKELHTPKFALTTNNNQHIFQYWQNESQRSTLNFLITEDRISQLRKYARLGKSLIVYCFTHATQGKLFFYTADEVQLKKDRDFMKQYLSFAANKKSFMVFDLSLVQIDKQFAYSPLTLSNTLTSKNEYLNSKPSQEVLDIVAGLDVAVVVQDITTKASVDFYAALDAGSIDMKRIKSFGHDRLAVGERVEDIGITYANQRRELRFKYATPLELEIENVKWTGISQDFSTLGLKVKLDKSSVLVKGDIVFLTFPKLQKITSSFELKKLPYQVVKINKNKTIVNLKVHVEKHQHIGRSFFKLLIEKNQHKLTPDEYAMMTPGLVKSLRNIYAAITQVPNVIIQTSGSRYKTELLTCGENFGRLLYTMKLLSDRKAYYNLYPLVSDLAVQSFISEVLKQNNASEVSKSEVLYIAIKPELEIIDEAVKTKLESAFSTDEEKRTFVSNALKMGEFFAIQLKLSRSDEPLMEYLNPELSYIGSYAIHRGKQVEQEIYSVAGVMQLYDITHEAMLKHNLAAKH